MANRKAKQDFGATAEFRIRRKKKKGLAGWQKFLIAIAVILCAAVLAVAGAFTYFKYIHKPVSDVGDLPLPNIGDNIPTDTPDDGLNVPDNVNKVQESRYNFLVIGCDRREWLSDVIMIATYDVKEKSVAIMQIPRDTYVTVNNKLLLDENGVITSENFDGKNDYGCKINAVLGHGGNFAAKELSRLASLAANATDAEIDALCKESFLEIDRKTLNAYTGAANRSEKTELEYDVKLKFGIKYLSALLTHSFGTPIDFYAQVNLDGFVNIVNAIGGVDVYVQEDMNYDDPLQDLHIHIKKGQQHLDGKAAEGFIRFRYGYAAADIARIDAQKIFMTAFLKKVISLEGIMNLDALVKEVAANLNTNISLSDALYFATNALDLDFSKVVMLTMPGAPATPNGVSYYSIDKKTMMEYVNTYLNKYSEPLGEEHFHAVEIASGNISTPPLTAADITDNQPDLGFMYTSSVGTGSNKTSQSAQTTQSEPDPTPDDQPQTPDTDTPVVETEFSGESKAFTTDSGEPEHNAELLLPEADAA